MTKQNLLDAYFILLFYSILPSLLTFPRRERR